MLPAAEPVPELPLCGRLTAGGASVLSDGELTGLVLLCSPAEGQRVVDLIGGARALAKAGMGDLCGLANLSLQRACRLKAAIELGRRALDEPLDRGAPMSTPEQVAARMRGLLAGLEREEMHVLGIDNLNRLVTHFVAAVGSINRVHVSPRDVFRALLREGAQALILVHNHPSGAPEPSASDRELTDVFARAGRQLGVPLLDHIILARDGHYSFADDPQRKTGRG
ncbi:MAG TPA: DNA repair protein RadC [Polyangia bacterium]|nr:DNA repair protein RadC [Polyangia bacterium]